MEHTFNPLTTIYQSQLETTRRVADAIFSGTEKIDRALIGATRQAMAEQYRLVQAFAGARDGGAVAGLQSGVLATTPESMVNYQKELLGIVVEMQNEIGRSVQDCVEKWRQQATSSAPAAAVERSSNTAFDPVTGMFSVWESAFKEVAALARKNMMAAHPMQGAGFSAVDNAARMAEAAAAQTTSAASAAADAASTAANMPEGGSEDRRGSSPSGGKRK